MRESCGGGDGGGDGQQTVDGPMAEARISCCCYSCWWEVELVTGEPSRVKGKRKAAGHQVVLLLVNKCTNVLGRRCRRLGRWWWCSWLAGNDD